MLLGAAVLSLTSRNEYPPQLVADQSPAAVTQAGSNAIVPVAEAAPSTSGDDDRTVTEDVKGDGRPVDDIATVTTSSEVIPVNPSDPMSFARHRRENVSRRQMAIDYPKGNKKKLKQFYTRQNELIDQFLGAGDEERLAVAEGERVGPKIKVAVYASFTVNFCLFVIQLYAAISTGSLSVP